jgi:hypothetical protein
MEPFGRKIEDVERAAFGKDDPVATQAREIDVVIAEVREFAEFLRIETVRPNVFPAILVAIG